MKSNVENDRETSFDLIFPEAEGFDFILFVYNVM